MKKRITLLIAAALLTVIGAQAESSVKTHLILSDFTQGWGSGKTVNATTITKGNGESCGFEINNQNYKVSDYDKLVVTVTASGLDDLYIRVSNSNDGFIQQNIGTVSATTSFTIDLPGNSFTGNGSVNVETIQRIYFGSEGSSTGSATISAIYFEKDYTDATTLENTPLNISGFTAGWGDGRSISENTIKKENTNNTGFELNNISYNVSDYDWLVVTVTNSDLANLYVRVSGASDNWVARKIGSVSSEKTFAIPLSGSTLTPEGGSGDITTITRIYFIDDQSETGSATITSINLVKAADKLIRTNTAADKYGTICLPFAADAPSNATVYDVVGYYGMEASNPSALYLSEVNSLTAGKAYVFKSTDANDITFTKTGTDDNLNDPIASTNMLHGQFSGEVAVPENSYILSSNKWKKVAANNNNKVKNYRAYLTLANNLFTTTPPSNAAPGMIIMDMNGSDATGISQIENGELRIENFYDLSGRSVSQPTKKGIYVKNGKKYVVK